MKRFESRLFACSHQIRSLRASDGAIADLQLTGPRARLRRFEHHADLATGLGSEAGRARRRGDTEVSGRRNRYACQRYGLLVGQRERLRGAGRPTVVAAYVAVTGSSVACGAPVRLFSETV